MTSEFHSSYHQFNDACIAVNLKTPVRAQRQPLIQIDMSAQYNLLNLLLDWRAIGKRKTGCHFLDRAENDVKRDPFDKDSGEDRLGGADET